MTDLSRAIATVLAADSRSTRTPAELKRAAAHLSARYRAGTATPLQSDLEADAYLATRLPATTAAVAWVMKEVARSWVTFEPETQLDLGAGPGAAAWAAASVWPSITKVTLVDRDERMLKAGKALAAAHTGTPSTDWHWQHSDIVRTTPALPLPLPLPADVVTLAYVLGELEPDTARAVATTAWSLTKGCLIVAEPGTPAGFELIRMIRAELLRGGANLLAPCPHEGHCPMSDGDWCHFAVRLDRSPTHRQLKGAERSFEDEKVSYLAFARQSSPPARAPGRVLRHPSRRRRFVELTVCAGDEVVKVPVGQSDPAYRAAARLRWGDAIPPTVETLLDGRRPQPPEPATT